MPVRTLRFRPGVNKERTRYANEGTWYDSDKVRFRQGLPEKIGGWTRLSAQRFTGVCRSLYNWITLDSTNYIGVGTNSHFYVYRPDTFVDITPFHSVFNGPLGLQFRAGLSRVELFDSGDGAFTASIVGLVVGGEVTLSGFEPILFGGVMLSPGRFQVVDIVAANRVALSRDGYSVPQNVSTGTTMRVEFHLPPGQEVVSPVADWGSGEFASGVSGGFGPNQIRLWSQASFGEDLIINPRGGALYYWDSSGTERAVNLTEREGASDVPTAASLVLVSDVSRFVFAFGANELGQTEQDLLLVRWSAQENAVCWTPSITNQAGGIRLSRGAAIVSVQQARQEILVWTNTSLYALQYVGPPVVWSVQIVGEHISVASPNATAYSNGVAYWMGIEKFYFFDGRLQELRCDVRRYLFEDINYQQLAQVFSGVVEPFHEIWWFYCSADSERINRYVVYNYQDKVWYVGTMARTAWFDSGLRVFPLSVTYEGHLLNHEDGVDDGSGAELAPIRSHIDSAGFDIGDGDKFMFVDRIIPDVSFEGSTEDTASVTMHLTPEEYPGRGDLDPPSTNTDLSAPASGGIVQRNAMSVDRYTEQVHTRIRGRQMVFRVASDGLGTQWQLGALRASLRPDGRR